MTTARGAHADDPGAAPFVPARPSLASLRRAAEGCRGCPLHRTASHAVIGEGPRRARVMLVGEQPGNDEDLAGHVFVGPAGRMLDRALEEAGLDREALFLTNVVKHFSWEPRGKRRIHKTPAQRHVDACIPWLEAESRLVAPHVVVCLGAVAARAIVGRDARVTESAGVVTKTAWCERTLATLHPSAVLRARSTEDRDAMFARLVSDLALAKRLARP
jgi:uracil-DNA glycosylase